MIAISARFIHHLLSPDSYNSLRLIKFDCIAPENQQRNKRRQAHSHSQKAEYIQDKLAIEVASSQWDQHHEDQQKPNSKGNINKDILSNIHASSILPVSN